VVVPRMADDWRGWVKVGTRNTTLVQLDGEYKVAKYCQWDGYPEGQGLGVLSALREIGNDKFLEVFKDKVRTLPEITQEQIDAINATPDWSSVYPFLSRDMGGGSFITELMNGNIPFHHRDPDFPADSLFCEWCYVVDLDRGTFEVYKGFNQEPLEETERFYPLSEKSEGGYQPVKLAQGWPLSELPTDEQFIKTLSDDEEQS